MSIRFNSYCHQFLSPVLLWAAAAAHASDDHHHHHAEEKSHQQQHTAADDAARHQGAHVHGQATLNLALDGGELLIELHSPLMNIAGFEHAPRNAEEVAHLGQALGLIENPASAFTLLGGGCTLSDRQFDLPEALRALGHDHHGADGDHATELAHSDVTVNYHFRCQAPAQWQGLELHLFEHYPHLERVTANWIAGDRQGQSQLTATDATLHLH